MAKKKHYHINKRGINKNPRWPKKEKLSEAVDVVSRFQQMSKLQMDLGYWVTMDFPTKHHINKILSLQYMDIEIVERVYGKRLVKQALGLIPACRSYVAFTKGEYDHEQVDNNKSRKGSGEQQTAVHEGPGKAA